MINVPYFISNLKQSLGVLSIIVITYYTLSIIAHSYLKKVTGNGTMAIMVMAFITSFIILVGMKYIPNPLNYIAPQLSYEINRYMQEFNNFVDSLLKM